MTDPNKRGVKDILIVSRDSALYSPSNQKFTEIYPLEGQKGVYQRLKISNRQFRKLATIFEVKLGEGA